MKNWPRFLEKENGMIFFEKSGPAPFPPSKTPQQEDNLTSTTKEITKQDATLIVAMPVQFELRRLFHLMNIQTHRISTQKALFLGA